MRVVVGVMSEDLAVGVGPPAVEPVVDIEVVPGSTALAADADDERSDRLLRVELEIVEVSGDAVDGPDADNSDARPSCPVNGEAGEGGAEAIAGPRRRLAADDAMQLAG